MKNIRILSIFAALAVAAASQALTLNYAGNGPLNGNTTTSLGYLGDDFAFAKSITVGNTITLSDISGQNGLRLTAAGLTPNALFSGIGTATGFGIYSGYSAGSIGVNVTTIDMTSYGVYAQGTINATPEPASIAALGVGALGLMRKRKKA